MAKEKFERTKPHVNVGGWLKQKLGLGSDEEPPIEPFDNSDPGALATPEASDADAIFNPKEFTISKSVPWGTSGDANPAESSTVPLMSIESEHAGAPFDAAEALGPGALQDTNGEGLPETQPPDSMWLPASPTPGEEAEGAGQNDLRFMKSRSGHGLSEDDDEFTGETSEPKTQHDPVYQQNQTNDDMAEGPIDDYGRYKVKMPFDSADETSPGPALPESDDQVLMGFEQGDPQQPVILGSMWNGQDVAPPAGSVPMPYPNLSAQDGSTTEDASVGPNLTETVGANEAQDAGDTSEFGEHVGNFNFHVEIAGGTEDSALAGEIPDGQASGVEEGGLNASAHKLAGPAKPEPEVGQQDESNLEFLKQRAAQPGHDAEDGDPEQPIIAGNVSNPDGATEAEFDPLTTFSFKISIDAVSDEPGDSTLVGDFKVSETMMPFEAADASPDPDAVDFDDIDAELDD